MKFQDKKISCIALDLDKTTLNKQGKLESETRMAISRLAEAGILIIVASGRPYCGIPDEVAEIPGVEYAITSNGAGVYRIGDDQKLHGWTMSPESVKKIIDLTESEPLKYECFIDGQAYADAEYVEDPIGHGATELGKVYIQGTRKPVRDMREFLLEHSHELDSFDLVTKDEELKEYWITRLVSEVDDIYVTSSVIRLIEVSHKNCGKHSGLRYLLEQLCISAEEMMAFGDGDNDVEMLEMAGIGVAVANGSDRCKKAADLITNTNVDLGVAHILNQIE